MNARHTLLDDPPLQRLDFLVARHPIELASQLSERPCDVDRELVSARAHPADGLVGDLVQVGLDFGELIGTALR